MRFLTIFLSFLLFACSQSSNPVQTIGSKMILDASTLPPAVPLPSLCGTDLERGVLTASGKLDNEKGRVRLSSGLVFWEGPYHGEIVKSGFLRSNNKILLAMTIYFASEWESPKGYLVQLNPDGSLDASFGCSGTLAVKLPHLTSYNGVNYFEYSDGRLLIVSEAGLYRITADGKLDGSFSSTGEKQISLPLPKESDRPDQPWSQLTNFAIQPDGKILGAGKIGLRDSLRGSYVVRFDQDGKADAGFGRGGIQYFRHDEAGMSLESEFVGLALASDGKVLLAENFLGAALVRLNADGSTDNSYGNLGRVQLKKGINLDLLDGIDSDLYLAGTLDKDLVLIRVREGAIDVTFGDQGYATATSRYHPGYFNNAMKPISILSTHGSIAVTADSGSIYEPVGTITYFSVAGVSEVNYLSAVGQFPWASQGVDMLIHPSFVLEKGTGEILLAGNTIQVPGGTTTAMPYRQSIFLTFP